MQLFRELETTTSNNSLYDGEAARKVLARASEIESNKIEQPKPELLNASQIEALGAEIGLSPEAIRRALGEAREGAILDGTTSTRTNGRRSSIAVPLTQERVRAAYLPTLWYALLCFPAIFILSRLIQSHTVPQDIGALLGITVSMVIPVVLAFRSGYLTRRAGVGAIGGFLSTLAIAIMVVTAVTMADPVRGGGSVPAAFFLLALVGAVAGTFGAVAHNWWESLPKNSDR